MATRNHDQVGPAFLNEHLCKRIGPHRIRRQGMQQVGATVGVAQRVIPGRGIEQDRASGLSQIGNGNLRFGGGIQQQERAAQQQGPCRRLHIPAGCDARHLQRIFLAQEPSRGVVVLHAHDRSGET